MTPIFSYNTLKVFLEKSTKSIHIFLSRPECQNAINTEMIFELETLLTWIASHLEISSVYLSGEGEIFSTGLDIHELQNQEEKQLCRNLEKLQKVIYAMFFLPQTILVDFKTLAFGVAAELGIGADLRFAKHGAKIKFNHLDHAMIPACGGIHFLGAILPKSFARNWALSAMPISQKQLLDSGFIHELYENDSSALIHTHLTQISRQSPVSRIQTKRSLLDSILGDLDQGRNQEKEFAIAGMVTKDWKKAINADLTGNTPEFTSPKELAQILQAHRAANLEKQ